MKARRSAPSTPIETLAREVIAQAACEYDSGVTPTPNDRQFARELIQRLRLAGIVLEQRLARA